MYFSSKYVSIKQFIIYSEFVVYISHAYFTFPLVPSLMDKKQTLILLVSSLNPNLIKNN